jgi:hypothetical protein
MILRHRCWLRRPVARRLGRIRPASCKRIAAAKTSGIGPFDDVADKMRSSFALRKWEFSLRWYRGQAQNTGPSSYWHGLCSTMCFDAEMAIA